MLSIIASYPVMHALTAMNDAQWKKASKKRKRERVQNALRQSMLLKLDVHELTNMSSSHDEYALCKKVRVYSKWAEAKGV